MSTKANTKPRKNKQRKHNHFPLGKTGYIPTGTNTAINVKKAKKICELTGVKAC